jgi:hypothetical protein
MLEGILRRGRCRRCFWRIRGLSLGTGVLVGLRGLVVFRWKQGGKEGNANEDLGSPGQYKSDGISET